MFADTVLKRASTSKAYPSEYIYDSISHDLLHMYPITNSPHSFSTFWSLVVFCRFSLDAIRPLLSQTLMER